MMLPKKLKQKAQEYVEFRNNNHDKDFPEGWGEAYKWKILPEAHEEFVSSSIVKENIIDKIELLSSYNPNAGSFCHWSLLDDLKKFTENNLEAVVQFFQLLTDESKELQSRIENAVELFEEKRESEDIKTGTPIIGYILAVYNYKKYPIYKDSVMVNLKDSFPELKISYGRSELGRKYRIYAQLCMKVGNYIDKEGSLKEIESEGVEISPGYTALDGQDFFYYLESYNKKDKENKLQNNMQQDLDFDGFTNKTFDYLEQVHNDTSYEALKEITDEVHEYAVHPLRDLLKDVGVSFDERNILKLEKEKYLTSNLFKANPRLGGWSHIWGALYQKDKKRISSMQFFVGIDKDNLAYGIHHSSNKEIKERIVQNIENFGDELGEFITEDIFENYYFDDVETTSNLKERCNPDDIYDLLELFKKHNLNIRKIIDSDEAIDKGQNLISEIRETFEELVPLYVLGITDQPIELLEKYYQKDLPSVETTEKITKQDLLNDLFLDEKNLDEILELLDGSDKQQIILQGPPGTGKTYIAREVAKYLTQTEANINTIQFHPSYSYEDFMEGYRPTSDGDFSLEDGVFKKLCDEARSRPDEKFVMIIDEINRGNLSKVFGELMYLLEYRGEEVQLTYSKKSFSIPENVYLIGTMNTADRSLAIMDYALRRRFYFVDQPPRLDQLEQWLDSNAKLNAEQVVEDIQKMNEKIENFMGSKDYNVGHSYFMKEGLDEDSLSRVLNYEVRPLLQEYFFDNPGKVEGILDIFE